MLASGIVYVGNGLLSGELGKLLYTPADNAGMWPMIAYYLRLRKAPPQYDDYNSLQKLSYTMVLLLIGPLIAATGIAMWTKTGGRAMGLLHLGLALELVLFFFGHTIMVATTGLWNNVHSMITGWYRRPAHQAAVTPERAPTTAQSREASLTRA
jgi:thiosulfate reductase cytochrome b subunit